VSHPARLTPETINLIEGFLGIEEYVGDYVEEGLEMFRDNRMRCTCNSYTSPC